MSWYKTDQKFTVKQRAYFKLLEKTFRIADAHGGLMDYKPLEYQKEMHSVVPMALPQDEWENVWTYKGRGIGASRIRMMDMILHCLSYRSLVFPIIIHRQDTGVEWIKVAKELIHTAKIDLVSEIKKPYNKMEIEFKNTGCKILLFPSSNVNSVRSVRTIFMVLDEIEFFRDIKNLLAAVRPCMNQGGVGLFQSTVYSRTTYFWETREKFLKGDVKHGVMQNYPLFDPDEFQPNVSIVEQVENGLKPIGFWYNIKKLEEDRSEDEAIFMQENMIVPISDTDSWYPFNLVMSCVKEDLVSQEFFTTMNPVFIGIDFGRNHDFTSISIFEKTEYGYVQRFQKFLKNMSMPDQRVYIEKLIEFIKPTKVRTDSTGMGLGISEELLKKFGTVVELIPFTKISKEKMATNLKSLMSDVKILFLNDSMLIKHMASVDYDLKSVRDSDDGHADGAWSIALAVLQEGHQTKGHIVAGSVRATRSISNSTRKGNILNPINRLYKQREDTAKALIDEKEKKRKEKINKFKKISRRLKELEFACPKRKEILNRDFCIECDLGCHSNEDTQKLIISGGVDFEQYRKWKKAKSDSWGDNPTE